jgi:hypothetical protein
VEVLRLQPRPLSKLITGHTVGETKVVVDPSALPCLTASCRSLHYDRLEAL